MLPQMHFFDMGVDGPAGLNFADLYACAVAPVAGMPLLWTGEDFARTDIQSPAET